MRLIAWLLVLVVLWSVVPAWADRPLVLVAQVHAPPKDAEPERYDPHLDITPHLTRYLKELRKLEVIAYDPKHPTVQRFAYEKKLERNALERPDTALLLQIGRAFGATYVLVVRCARPQESLLLEYQAELWQPGQRAPLWQHSGNQRVLTRDSGIDASLQSLARTLAVRLNEEVWSNLPTLPETPLSPPSPSREKPSPSSGDKVNTGEIDLNKLLSEGRLSEALPLLRAAVNQNSLDATLRIQLIELYQQLGLNEAALEECERALRLMPQNERLVQLWARLMQAQGRVAEAIQTLQTMLETAKSGSAASSLRLVLFDLQLLAGDFAGAEATLSSLHPADSPEVRWRAYLMQGVKRQFNKTQEPIPLTRDRLPGLLLVANGAMNDLANELLNLKRLASDPSPDWKALRQRGEQMVIHALDFGAWLSRLQPDEATRALCAHLQFGAHLMGQAAQQMARYLLFRKAEDLENATLLRAEALRELAEVARLSEADK
ncbi:MAG: tetratricopeptide repeat protein [Armatimonadota bacterium]